MSNSSNVANNLYQTFYTFGWDTDITYSENFYSNPLSLNYTPVTLTKFPPFQNSFNTLPDRLIIQHCFPTGFYLSKSNPKPKGEKYFFNLSNFPNNKINLYKYSKIYFSCFLFYESLNNYAKWYSKMIGKNFEDAKYQELYVPKVICLASVREFPRESTRILKLIYTNYMTKSPLIPLEKIIEHLIFSIPIPPRGEFIINYKLFDKTFVFSETPINTIPNPSYKIFKFFREIPVDDFLRIYKALMWEIPILFFSTNKKDLCNITEYFISLLYPFKYRFPQISILPVNSYSLIQMSSCFVFGINEKYSSKFFEINNIEIDDKLIIIVDIDLKTIEEKRPKEEALRCWYLEEKIDENWFNYNINLFRSIEFPRHYINKIRNHIAIYLSDIKNQKIREAKASFNKTIRDEFYLFWVSIFLDYAKHIIFFNENCYESTTNKWNREMEENWNKFITLYNNKRLRDTIVIDDIYNSIDYVNSFYGIDSIFYKRFVSTKLFWDFIIRKWNPLTYMDKVEILLFDERIISKKNRNWFSKLVRLNKTPLIQNQDLGKTTIISIETPRRFTMPELKINSRLSFKKLALTYYQEINIIDLNNQLDIKYSVFPKWLSNDIFLKSDTTSLILPINLITPFEQSIIQTLSNPIYMEIYNNTKYCFDIIEKHDIEQDIKHSNFVYLTFCLVWSGTLWYCNTELEMDIRFNYLLSVIEEMEILYDDILEYLYLVVVKYGSEQQCIRLYELWSKINSINPYTLFSLLCMKISKSINAKINNREQPFSNVTLIMRENEESDKPLEVNEINNSKFQERGMKGDQTYTFDNLIKCQHCGEENEINFKKILERSINEKEVIRWKCFKCSKDWSNTQSNINHNIFLNCNFEDIDYRFELLSPREMFTLTRKLFINHCDYKINVEGWKEENEMLFFNYILYFNFVGLGFDFIIPYEGKNKNSSITAGKQGKKLSAVFNHLEIDQCVIQFDYLLDEKENNEFEKNLKGYSKRSKTYKKNMKIKDSLNEVEEEGDSNDDDCKKNEVEDENKDKDENENVEENKGDDKDKEETKEKEEKDEDNDEDEDDEEEDDGIGGWTEETAP